MLKLKTETLYLTSGAPAAGKSTFLSSVRMQDPLTGTLRELPAGSVLSSDALRLALFGAASLMVDGRPAQGPRDLRDGLVFETLERAVEARMQQRLTTFVDAMLLTDTDRETFARHARKHGMDVRVLLFDVPLAQAQARNVLRAHPVPAAMLEGAHNRLARESVLPLVPVTEANSLEGAVLVERRMIPEDHGLDVVGDTHGLLEPLYRLLGTLGYQLVETPEGSVPVHPGGRKLLFLGDMVDRGDDSVALLDFVRRAVQHGGHYAIRGNHEHKLLAFLAAQEANQLKSWNSAASATTGLDLLRQPADKKERLITFLRGLPGYYIRGRMAFVHADIGRKFVPGAMALGECMYGARANGESPVDSDALARAANSAYWLVRGHIPETSPGLGTVTVYENAEFGGNLVSLWVPEGRIHTAEQLAALPKVRVPTGFDYAKVLATRSPLKRDLDRLVKDGLVTRAVDPRYGFTLYKYSKAVFYDNLWGRHPALLRARGIVFDIAGKIVQHPFTKVFNFNENGTDLPPDLMVVAPVKMNGYMASVSLHPVEPDQLLVTTTGSFDSDFVKLTTNFIKKQRAMGPLLRELRDRPGLTLLFEVVHPEDPHIVQYTAAEHGLYLIGARDCGQETSLEWREEALDEMGALLGGCVRRSAWDRLQFGALLERSKDAQNAEGWMVRADDADQRTLLKLKTPWYLTTKFLGRMNDANVRFLFQRPEQFKRNVDEEFFHLVDQLSRQSSATEYLALSPAERVALVAGLVQAPLQERASPRTRGPDGPSTHS